MHVYEKLVKVSIDASSPLAFSTTAIDNDILTPFASQYAEAFANYKFDPEYELRPGDLMIRLVFSNEDSFDFASTGIPESVIGYKEEKNLFPLYFPLRMLITAIEGGVTVFRIGDKLIPIILVQKDYRTPSELRFALDEYFEENLLVNTIVKIKEDLANSDLFLYTKSNHDNRFQADLRTTMYRLINEYIVKNIFYRSPDVAFIYKNGIRKIS